MTAVASPPLLTRPRRFDNAAQWLHALGDVPLERIIFDPLPGTATEADLLRFVEGGDKLCELIDGTLVEKPVGYLEAIIAFNLGTDINNYVRPRNLGVVSGADSTLRMASSGRVRLPNVAFISRDRMPKTLEPIPTIAPDLAVEVLSPSNTHAEMAQKLREYFQSGTRLVWFIDPPTRTVAVYHGAGEPTRVLAEGAMLDGEQVLPGFALPVAELFRNLPPGG
ncbi:MAG TPA: Uma2 family endonuclease [Tepidisphaeraceae bacterium]|nr:Uma2 family endonuclease [Tepidisphaeraceae bacterium]